MKLSVEETICPSNIKLPGYVFAIVVVGRAKAYSKFAFLPSLFVMAYTSSALSFFFFFNFIKTTMKITSQDNNGIKRKMNAGVLLGVKWARV